MLDFTEYTKIFISLFAIIDPIGIIPIIIAFTAGMTAQKRERVGRMASLSVLGILLAALLLGEAILEFFGISIHSFRTAGGILLLLMSITMLIGNKPAPTPNETPTATPPPPSPSCRSPRRCWPGPARSARSSLMRTRTAMWDTTA